MAKAIYTPTDAMAVLPSAIGFTFETPESRANTNIGTSTVVEICGPLTSRDECPFFDNYEDITERFAQALKEPTQRVVLLISSPGGDVFGCFQAAESMRAMADAAGKPVIAYGDRTCCSAGYALASVADRIIVNPTGTMGSVGVLLEREDVTKAMEQNGISRYYVSTGTKKTFGRPDVPYSAEEEAELQAKGQFLGDMFFSWVASRRGLSTEQIKAMQAGTFIGAQAVQQGLADEVASLDQVLSSPLNPEMGSSETFYQASSGDPVSGATVKEATVNLQECLSALKAIAESDSADSEAAKAVLTAMAAPKAEAAPAEEDKKDPPAEEPAKAEDMPADPEKCEAAPVEDNKPEDDSAAKAAASAAEFASMKAELESLKNSIALDAVKAKAQAHTSLDQKSGAKTVAKQKWETDMDIAMGLAKDESPQVTVTGNVQRFRL